MTVFITSSPFVDGADRAVLNPENGFVDRLGESLPPFCRALFVCSSPDRRDLNCRFGADVFIAFAEAGIHFSSYAVLDAYNAHEAEELVARSDFLILAGGHVPTQNAFFEEIHLRELLQFHPGVVMGISAGSMNCADVVYAQPEEPGESDPDFERFLPGLGLTDVNVLPHYQKVKDDMLDGLRLFEDITYADSMGQCFFALVDGSYLLIEEDGTTTLFGEAYCIQDGEIEQISELGDVVAFEEDFEEDGEI